METLEPELDRGSRGKQAVTLSLMTIFCSWPCLLGRRGRSLSAANFPWSWVNINFMASWSQYVSVLIELQKK